MRRLAFGAALSLCAAAYGFLRWRPFRVEVSGPSMRPTLEPGDWAVATTPGRVRPGDVVVIEHPGRPGFEMVKRVVRAPSGRAPDGRLLREEVWVEGDDPARATDSRTFGAVPMGLVRGRVRAVWWPPSHVRVL
jgi:inner membrane protease subunit 1